MAMMSCELALVGVGAARGSGQWGERRLGVRLLLLFCCHHVLRELCLLSILSPLIGGAHVKSRFVLSFPRGLEVPQSGAARFCQCGSFLLRLSPLTLLVVAHRLVVRTLCKSSYDIKL